MIVAARGEREDQDEAFHWAPSGGLRYGNRLRNVVAFVAAPSTIGRQPPGPAASTVVGPPGSPTRCRHPPDGESVVFSSPPCAARSTMSTTSSPGRRPFGEAGGVAVGGRGLARVERRDRARRRRRVVEAAERPERAVLRRRGGLTERGVQAQHLGVRRTRRDLRDVDAVQLDAGVEDLHEIDAREQLRLADTSAAEQRRRRAAAWGSCCLSCVSSFGSVFPAVP